MSVGALVADLKAAFPRDRVPPETFDLYLRELADIPADALSIAIRDLIRTADRFPSIGAIRGAAVEAILSLPTEAQALAAIERRAQWARGRTEPEPHVHPLVREAVEHIGGYRAFRAADNPSVIRGQFLAIYRGLRAQNVRDVQTKQMPKELER